MFENYFETTTMVNFDHLKTMISRVGMEQISDCDGTKLYQRITSKKYNKIGFDINDVDLKTGAVSWNKHVMLVSIGEGSDPSLDFQTINKDSITNFLSEFILYYQPESYEDTL